MRPLSLLRSISSACSGERGQVTAWFIASAIVLFGITALAFDGGLIFLQRRTAQNVVDSAAIAGANSLPRCPLAAQPANIPADERPLFVAEDFADRNLVVGSNAVGDYGERPLMRIGSYHVEDEIAEADWQTVKVRVDRDQRFVFAQALGLFGVNVPAEAEATCGPIQEGTICPIWIAGDRNDPPELDADGNLIGDTAYGLTIGRVYGMKVNEASDHYGALDPPNSPGGGTGPWRQFMADGCEDEDDDAVLNVCEGTDPECDVNTKPGNFGNPVHCALEGCSALAAGTDGLYEIEKTNSTMFPNHHLSCNLHLVVDPNDVAEVLEVRRYTGGVASTSQPIWERDDPTNDDASAIVAAIDEMTDPDVTPTVGGVPCGGLDLTPGSTQGEPIPQLMYESVQGRFMYIAMTDGLCPTGGGNNSCDKDVLGILRMYIVCWTNQELPHSGGGQPPQYQPPEHCVLNPSNGEDDTTIYGVFAQYSAPNLLGGGGIGTNPLAPFHVVLVR